MSGDLVIGINAQISPRFPGGVETMLLSLLQKLGQASTAERFVLCSVPKHETELVPFVGPNQTLMKWPFSQAYFRPMAPDGLWSRLRAGAGRMANLVDLAHERYMDLRGAPHQPSARKADRLLRRRGVSVVHFPYGAHFGTKLPFVYEPWDLQHRHYPEFFTPQESSMRDRMYRSGCREAKLVITGTRWVKEDIVRQYGLPPEKVAVIPRSSLVAREPLSGAEQEEAWRRHCIPEDFAFYPAMTFKHKNHIRLFQALARLRDERGIRLPLVCSGRVWEPNWPAIEEELERLRLRGQVIFLGVVSDAMLASLFRSARFMVFPSLFEGLGAPLLEAMHHRLPILASNATSIPEVVGDAGILFDGQNVDAILDALSHAVNGRDALDRVASLGPAILSRYNWEKAAKTFVACYRHAAGRPLSEEQGGLLRESTRA